MESLQSQTAEFEDVWTRKMEMYRFFNEKSEETDFEKNIRRMEKNNPYYEVFHVEEYFLTAFEYGKKTYFGEEFDYIHNYLKGIATKDIFDLVLLNDKTVAIIEVKYKFQEKNIPTLLKKAETFGMNFVHYKDHRVYLGLASMAFYPELEQACIDSGIAIIKQVGDKVVINDKHLKVF